MAGKMFQVLYVPLFIVVLFINTSLACNGYSVKLNTIKNCVPNPVVKLPANGGVVLDSNCNIVLSGCLEITKPFKTAKGKYTVNKSPMPPIEGDLDFCDFFGGMDDPELAKLAAMFDAPKSCPIPAKKICGAANKKISIAKYKNQIGMASGTTDIKLEADHDTGKTCMQINLTVSKARRG